MGIEKPKRCKRTHSKEFKDELVGACTEPGVSISGIALANGVNPNLLRRWMRERGVTVPSLPQRIESGTPVMSTSAFVPVMITPSVPPIADIRIEARRGNAVVKVEWPVSAAGECAAWLRDWLK
jgi:transposase